MIALLVTSDCCDTVVEIDGIDAFAHTAVLDIKPHVPRFDSAPHATIPWWLKKK